MYVVYRHTCLKTNKSYVGFTKRSINQRWIEHVKNARRDVKYKLNAALRKHGTWCWKHDILERCDSFDEALLAERRWINTFDTYRCGYNMTLGGDGVCVTQRSLKHRQNLSLAAKRRTQEEKDRWRAVNVGRKHSKKTRDSWSKQRTGRKHSQETIQKLRELTPWNKGKTLSCETRQRMSESRKGDKNPFYGKHHSPETRQQISMNRRHKVKP